MQNTLWNLHTLLNNIVAVTELQWYKVHIEVVTGSHICTAMATHMYTHVIVHSYQLIEV